MIEENVSPKDIGYVEKDDYEQIQKLQVLWTLLNCLKDINCEYPLSAVLEYSREEYSEDILLQRILQLVDEAYVSVKPIKTVEENETFITAKQLIESEEYDNILIALQEQESGILLRGFVEANIAMLGMKVQYGEAEQKILSCEERLEQYEESYQAIRKKESDVRKCYEDSVKVIDTFKREYTIEWEELEKKLNDEQKLFKESILEEAEKKAADKIEEELTQRGKIGSALQDAQKNIIQFMAIFVAIFSLVSVNITNAGKWNYAELFRVNVIMTTSMFTLVSLIFIFTTDNFEWVRRLIYMVSGLWIVLAVTAGVSMCLY